MTIWQSKLNIAEIPAPDGARIGVVVDVENINKVEPRRTVNGRLIIVKSPFPKKAKISVQASGAAIRFEPAFDSLDLGDQVTITSPKYATNYILAGQTQLVLPQVPAVGGPTNARVIVEDRAGNPVPFAVAGSTVTLNAAQADITFVKYRPIYAARLISHSGSAAEVEGAQTWRGEFEEI